MAQEVRKVKLKNESGQTIDCLLKSSFFNDLGGLGYDENISYISYADGFYKPIKRLTSQSSISGKLSFLNRSTAYEDYRTLMEWITRAERQNDDGSIKIIYQPYGTEEYQKDVILRSISKGELDTGGFLSCSVIFQGITPWYSVDTLDIDFSEPTGNYTSRYTRTFTYVYLTSGTSLTARIDIQNAWEGRYRLEVSGSFTSPIIEMFGADGELIGYLELAGASFSSTDTLIVSTMPSGIGAWKETSGGTRTDLIDLIDIQDGVDAFFSIPANQVVTLRIRASGASNLSGDLYLYSFYKTR